MSDSKPPLGTVQHINYCMQASGECPAQLLLSFFRHTHSHGHTHANSDSHSLAISKATVAKATGQENAAAKATATTKSINTPIAICHVASTHFCNRKYGNPRNHANFQSHHQPPPSPRVIMRQRHIVRSSLTSHSSPVLSPDVWGGVFAGAGEGARTASEAGHGRCSAKTTSPAAGETPLPLSLRLMLRCAPRHGGHSVWACCTFAV